MTPKELKEKLDRGEKVNILDVREPQEIALATLGGTAIPLGDLSRRFSELDPSAEIVCLCHHGIRSAHAVGLLRHHGFTNVHNLVGGIDRWSIEIDPKVRRY